MDLYDYQWYPLPIAAQPAVFPNRPSGFFGASLAVAVPASLSSDATYWLFGGQNANTFFGELWTYSTRTCAWSMYAFTQAADKVPCGRCAHVSYFDALSGTLRVFGGQGDNGFLNGAHWLAAPGSVDFHQFLICLLLPVVYVSSAPGWHPPILSPPLLAPFTPCGRFLAVWCARQFMVPSRVRQHECGPGVPSVAGFLGGV